jgi:mRNA interferase MazF
MVLAKVQQADGQLKPRPVVVLSIRPPFSDALVCAVSSKLHHECTGFDEVVRSTDPDYSQSGLKVSSLIRLGLVATLPQAVIMGRLGRISDERLHRLQSRLARHIEISTGER